MYLKKKMYSLKRYNINLHSLFGEGRSQILRVYNLAKTFGFGPVYIPTQLCYLKVNKKQEKKAAYRGSFIEWSSPI